MNRIIKKIKIKQILLVSLILIITQQASCTPRDPRASGKGSWLEGKSPVIQKQEKIYKTPYKNTVSAKMPKIEPKKVIKERPRFDTGELVYVNYEQKIKELDKSIEKIDKQLKLSADYLKKTDLKTYCKNFKNDCTFVERIKTWNF